MIVNSLIETSQLNCIGRYGDPGKTRTSDTQFRKLLLYPPELRGHSSNILPQRLTVTPINHSSMGLN